MVRDPPNCEGYERLLNDDGSPKLDEDGVPIILGTCNVAGQLNSTNFAPAIVPLRVNFPLRWAYEEHATGFTFHLIGPIDQESEVEEDFGFYTIDEFFTIDFQYSYTTEEIIGEATTFTVGAYNILDTRPPFALTTQGFVVLHDPRGRMIYGKLIQEF